MTTMTTGTSGTLGSTGGTAGTSDATEATRSGTSSDISGSEDACGADAIWPEELPRTARPLLVDVSDGLQLPAGEGNGVAAGDVNGDGTLDLVVTTVAGGVVTLRGCTTGPGAPLCLEAVDLDSPIFARGVALADLDRDGDLDLLVAGKGGVELHLNPGDGAWEPAVRLPGVPPATVATGVALADVDGDGRVDVIMSGYDTPDSGKPVGAPNAMWLNRDGGFIEVAAAAGLSDDGATFTITAGDFDRDGRIDLFVANDTLAVDFGSGGSWPGYPGLAPDRLYRNVATRDGVPVFEEVGQSMGVAGSRSTMGGLLGDFDGDGADDLLLSDHGANDLLLGRHGVFVDATDPDPAYFYDDACTGCEPVLACLLVSWGSALEDLDLDGFADLVVINGAVDTGDTPAQPSLLWLGSDSGGRTVVDSPLGAVQGRGVVPVDLDNDGDLDLAVATRGMGAAVRILRNDSAGRGGRGIRVQLRGERGEPTGHGAVVTLELDDGRTLYRTLGTGGVVHSFAALEAHFGVAPGAAALAIEVLWPDGETTSHLVAADAVVIELSRG